MYKSPLNLGKRNTWSNKSEQESMPNFCNYRRRVLQPIWSHRLDPSVVSLLRTTTFVVDSIGDNWSLANRKFQPFTYHEFDIIWLSWRILLSFGSSELRKLLFQEYGLQFLPCIQLLFLPPCLQSRCLFPLIIQLLIQLIDILPSNEQVFIERCTGASIHIQLSLANSCINNSSDDMQISQPFQQVHWTSQRICESNIYNVKDLAHVITAILHLLGGLSYQVAISDLSAVISKLSAIVFSTRCPSKPQAVAIPDKIIVNSETWQSNVQFCTNQPCVRSTHCPS